ncbi:unnamed protein product [Candida verbasci]|uniref:Conserved oligomeric Golgi complex subunit 4 n=1 Tax=Candida verbasci TaxID=1227364 RepID=A0A9W4XBS6_9ASCO|nr:unnamed protein product [Candida verbasci]
MNGKSNATFQIDNIELENEVNQLKQQFQNSPSTNDVYKLIKSIDSKISKIDSELETITDINQNSLLSDITNIELFRSNKLLQPITNSNELIRIFHHANDLGHNLTFKIKSLDYEINNVNETLKFVENIQLLKNNISQAHYAIESKNWNLAANCIKKIKSLPKELVVGKFASIVIPSTDIPELPQVTLESWISKLTDVFKSEFFKAAEERNVENLTNFFQLFPLISKEEIGLNCYSKFICKIINETSKNLINSLNNKEVQIGIFSTITMQLFENISMMISQHGPLIKKYYSETYPTALNYVINKIQKEIDLQIGVISDTFYDVRRIDKCFQDINLYNFPILSKRLNEEIEVEEYEDDFLQIREIGDILSELSAILQNWSLYCKFITMRYFQDDKTKLLLPELIAKSNFTKKINEKLLPSFETLYKFYFRRSLEKSISIEELPNLELNLKVVSKSQSPDQIPVSSVIDDVTLILNNTLKSTIQSGIPLTVKTFLGESFKIIQQDLINGFFIKNLNDNQPRYNQQLSLVSEQSQVNPTTTLSPGNSRSGTPDPNGFFKGASSALGSVVSGSNIVTGLQTSPNNPKLMNFIIYLNTIAMGQEYFEKIITNLKKDNYLRNSFPFGKDKDIIENILSSDFYDPFISITNKIIIESLINLYNQSIKQKLISVVNDFLSESNESNYIIYQNNSINDPTLLIKFTSNWQSLIKPYFQTLHKSLYTKLLRLIIVNLSNLLDKKLLVVLKKFKINEFGSIKLEKDLSYVINEVCSDNYHLREKFIRITQIVLLVGMDDEEYEESKQMKTKSGEEEDDDEDESYGINWILTPQERNQIRRYRIQ